jgi:Na+/melibiose symporter-like transporter
VGWASPAAIAGYACAAAIRVAFIRVELRRNEPLVDLALFTRPAFATAVLGAVAVFVVLSVTLLLNTFYLQDARGWTPLAAGTAVLPLAAGATVCAPCSGILVGRVGPRIPLALAGVFTTAGGGLLWVTLTAQTAIPLLLTGYLCIGIGVGFANAPITNTALRATGE